jgi:hypothetical protein
MTKKIVNQFTSKLFIAGILFAFYACGTPQTNTETEVIETDPKTEIQQAVNKEANSEQENMEYAERAEANKRAVSFYDALKSGLYANTTEMVEPTMYKNFSETTWLEMLKNEATTKGNVEKYEMLSSKYEKVEGTNSGRKVEMTFQVTRKGQKYMEEMYWYKTDGEPFMLTELEYKKAETSTEDDD